MIRFTAAKEGDSIYLGLGMTREAWDELGNGRVARVALQKLVKGWDGKLVIWRAAGDRTLDNDIQKRMTNQSEEMPVSVAAPRVDSTPGTAETSLTGSLNDLILRVLSRVPVRVGRWGAPLWFDVHTQPSRIHLRDRDTSLYHIERADLDAVIRDVIAGK